MKMKETKKTKKPTKALFCFFYLHQKKIETRVSHKYNKSTRTQQKQNAVYR